MVDEVVERAAFVAEAKRRGWTPGDFMLGAYAGWLAAKNLAASPQAPAPQAVVGEASEQPQALNDLHATLKQALRIPGLPFPDPHAHSLDAYARAVHGAYCQLRFKIMDSIKLVESAMTVPAALTPSPAPSAAPHQGADALREALQNIANLEAPEVDADLLLPVRLARAAIAHHQAPQQGEQHE